MDETEQIARDCPAEDLTMSVIVETIRDAAARRTSCEQRAGDARLRAGRAYPICGGVGGIGGRGTSRPRGRAICSASIPSYMGKLKGVGKVWQVTACDVASSYGVARILPELTAAAVATSCE